MIMAICGVVVFLADIATKWLATQFLMHYPMGRIGVVPGYLDLYLRYNTGGAFSLFDGYPHLVTLFSVVAIIWIFWWGLKISRGIVPAQVAFGMILGGAIGNLFERILYRQVTDFVHVYYKDLAWPTFNLADSAIVAGIGLFVYLSLFTKKLDIPAQQPPAPKDSAASESPGSAPTQI